MPVRPARAAARHRLAWGAAAGWARAHDATRLHLRVIDRNETAIGFYEARGWQRIGHLTDMMGGTPIGVLVFARVLD